MISGLTLHGVGPAREMKLTFGERLNIITGDNGLGKSFLLDCVWWALTRSWPAELNQGTPSGRKARPNEGEVGKITAEFVRTSRKTTSLSATYNRSKECWVCPAGRPLQHGITLYAMVDGSIAVWDPARNYRRDEKANRISAYVFTPNEIWDGRKEEGQTLLKGLIEDYSNVNFRSSGGHKLLEQMLKILSPPGEDLSPGDTTRISVIDSRDIPTIRMPYMADSPVPIIHASSAIKRMLSIAYILVWAWIEHRIACKLRGETPTTHITFLIDEIEAHLHPRWQRTILPALLQAINELMGNPEVKLLLSTHSPLVMASCEDLFNAEQDRWFDLDYDKSARRVTLTNRTFEKQGTAEAWLAGEAFDLSSDRSVGAESVINEASALLAGENATPEELTEMEHKLTDKLNSHDPYLARWRGLVERKFSIQP